jgi:RHS repeat-associated protein
MCARIPHGVIDLLRKREVVRHPRFGANEPETERPRYQWPSREADAETDLTYNRARHFDPAIGRWLSADPLGFAAGEEHLYAYPALQQAHPSFSVE